MPAGSSAAPEGVSGGSSPLPLNRGFPSDIDIHVSEIGRLGKTSHGLKPACQHALRDQTLRNGKILSAKLSGKKFRQVGDRLCSFIPDPILMGNEHASRVQGVIDLPEQLFKPLLEEIQGCARKNQIVGASVCSGGPF